MTDSISATVPVARCPICGETSFGLLGERADGIPVLRCEHCRMGVVAEHPLDTAAYYSDNYYAQGEASEPASAENPAGYPAGYSEYPMVATHSLAWAGELIRLLSPGGKVLDVGCADGHLLHLLGQAYDRYGIEVNERLRERCERAGIRMLGPDIGDARLLDSYGGFFDVITAIAVLEHVTDIRTALDHIRALLAPEGVLVFEVPLISPAHHNSVWFNSSLEHIYYPTLEGLAFLFEAVFKLPLLGREVVIKDYGCTFVGLATRSPAKHRELSELLPQLMDSPLSTLAHPERSFRFFFELVHAATPTVENVALLAELDPERMTPELLQRLAMLWGLDMSRIADKKTPPYETAKREARLGEMRTALAAQMARSEKALCEMKAQLAQSEHALREAMSSASSLSGEVERLREDLWAIHSSRSWRMLVRYWKIRALLRLSRPAPEPGPEGARPGGFRLGAAAWQTARFSYRLLPISGRTRFKLRRAILAGLSVPDETPPEAAVARLRDLIRGLTWRRAASAAALLLRGDLAALKMHMNLFVQHSVNQETRQTAVADPPAELVERRQEPWPDSRPLVSVVIPCYNYGHFVSEAVDSVLAQTFQNCEILVVDGGSSEPTLAVLGKLNRPRTQVYFREGRHLVGDNRNFGIARAQGKYVCCLDADDLIKPTYLEKALFLLETQGYDLVSTSIRCFGDRSDLYHVKPYPVLADMLEGNHVSTCAVFRKDLWDRTEGYQDTGTGSDYIYEDWRLWVRFAALGARFANIVEEPLFLYRIHSPLSLSNQNQGVPTMDRQREAVAELNKDVITDEALRRSEESRRIKVRMQDGFVNLKRGWASAAADQPTILIAMPFLVIGGAERLISEVAVHLRSRGFRIAVVTTEYVYPTYGDSTAWLERSTAEIYHLPRFLEPNRWPEFIDYLLGTRSVSLLWIIGSRVFYDLLPKIKADYPDLKVIDLLFNTVGHTANNRKYAQYFDRILVENREVETWLHKAGEPPERVLQLPSGVDLEAYRPRSRSAGTLADLGLSGLAPDPFIAGYSGRLSEEKDPEAFLEIARRFRGKSRRDSRLVFLMTGAGPLAEQVSRRVGKMDLGGRLRFLGQVDDVRSTMAAYDVLILPSRFDGRPVAVLESLALGVPVIASRVGALPDLIEEGVTGFLCEPGDIDAFAERLRWLAGHPEEHRRMKVAARAFAEAALDARQMFERYEAAIRGVIAPASLTITAGR